MRVQFVPTTGVVLTIWTITTNTKDYGDRFVARAHYVGPGTVYAAADCYVADTLAGVRAMLPPGIVCVGRELGDDPVIVESWL